MAEATFILRAVDQTKQAFASVQNNLSRIDKTTRGISRGIKGFLAIGLIVGGLSKVSRLMGVIERDASKLGLSAKDVDNLSREFALLTSAMETLKTVGASVLSTFSSLANIFIPAETEQEKLNRAFQRAAPLIEEEQKKTRELRVAIDELGKSEGQLFLETKARISEMIKLSADQLRIGKPGESATTRREIAELQLENVRREISLQDKLSAATFRLGEAQRKLFGEKLPLQERINDLAFQEAQIMIKMQGLSEDDLEGRTILTDELGNVMERTNSLLERQGILGTQAGEMIAFAFEDAIFSGQKLSEVLKQLGLDLVRLVFSNLVTQPLATGIGDFFKGFRAEGGPVGSGKSYIVGERGPELFVPGSSGSIVPNDAMRGGGSGGTSVNITYHISSGVSRAELTPILETERQRLKAEIPDMVRRGGSYRAAFA
jgi:hypothetical protein